MQKNINRMWLFHIIVFCVPLLSIWFAISEPRDAKAQSTPTGTLTPTATLTPTSVPTSQASWRPQGVRRIPVRLQDTAEFGLGGAGGPIGDCSDLILPNDGPEIWRLSDLMISVIKYPDSESPYLDQMTDLNSSSLFIPFSVWSCGGKHDPSTQVILYSSNGHVEELQGDLTNPGDATSGYTYSRIFSANDPSGVYTLELQNSYGLFSRKITVDWSDYVKDHYQGPRFTLHHSATSDDQNKFRPGTSIQINYSKYSASEFVEVGIYHLTNEIINGMPSYKGYDLINSWVFQTDSNGQYSDIVPIPANTVAGDYVVVASPIESGAVSTGSLGLNLLTPNFEVGTVHFYHLGFQVIDPVSIVQNYYQAIQNYTSYAQNSYYLPIAYAYLSQNFRARQSYEDFVNGFATTNSVNVEKTTLVHQDTHSAVVEVVVEATDEIQGKQQTVHYDITWQLILEDDNWRLDSAQTHTSEGADPQSSKDTSPVILDPLKALDPVKVTASFYEALNTGAATDDFHTAYDYLSISRKASRSYEAFKAIYANTRQVQVERIESLEENETNAKVHIIVRLTALVNSALQETRYDVTYQLVKEDGDWHLDQFKSTKL